MLESNRIELKRELTDGLEKEVVAFLNYKDGGLIFIGIDDITGKTIGIDNIDEKQLKIKDRLKNNTDNFLRIVFPFDKDVQKKLKAQEKALKKTEAVQKKDIVKDTVKDTVKLSKNELLIIESMRNNPKITSNELVKIIGINLRNTKKCISKLKNEKIIERNGSDKSGEWIVLIYSE